MQPPWVQRLGEYSKDLVDLRGSRDSDGLRSGGVGSITNSAGDAEIRSYDLLGGDTEMVERLIRCENEHLVE